MIKIRRIKLKVLVLFFVFCFLSSHTPVLAAVLYFKPDQGRYYQGDTFIEEIRLDTQGEYINTAKITLSFPKDILELKDFSKGNSILTLWIKTPSAEDVNISNYKGSLSFIGGVPAGYQGWNGVLGRIIFKVRKESQAKRLNTAELKFLDNSQVLLNNGLGSPAKLKIEKAILTISPEKRKYLKNEWQEELKKDITPPEPFEVKINKNPMIFGGKYFLIFSTTDKQTGIDHYEVQENRKQNTKSKNWKLAKSPYLLEDQDLQSIIKVKAVDKAGNKRTIFITPRKISNEINLSYLFPLIILIIIIIIVGIIWLRNIIKRDKASIQNKT